MFKCGGVYLGERFESAHDCNHVARWKRTKSHILLSVDQWWKMCGDFIGAVKFSALRSLATEKLLKSQPAPTLGEKIMIETHEEKLLRYKREAEERIAPLVQFLRANNMKIRITSCGCCFGALLKLAHNDTVIFEDDCLDFDMFEE